MSRQKLKKLFNPVYAANQSAQLSTMGAFGFSHLYQLTYGSDDGNETQVFTEQSSFKQDPSSET